RAYCDSSSGLRKSSLKTSPGWLGGKSGIVRLSLMIVDDLDIIRMSIAPTKTDAPLVVYSDAVLSFSLTDQAFQPVSRRSPEIVEIARVVYLHQLAVRSHNDVVGNAFDETALPRGFGGGIPKRFDH